MDDGSVRHAPGPGDARPAARGATTLRERVERSLAAAQPAAAVRASLLDHVEGHVSPALLELIEQPTQRAAVLLALVERREGYTVLFTERGQHLPHHPGQVSFPGGRFADDREDA